jgi:hypothetical protein
MLNLIEIESFIKCVGKLHSKLLDFDFSLFWFITLYFPLQKATGCFENWKKKSLTGAAVRNFMYIFFMKWEEAILDWEWFLILAHGDGVKMSCNHSRPTFKIFFWEVEHDNPNISTVILINHTSWNKMLQ